MEIPKVPEGHPRVYVRPDDLTGIRAKLDLPEFASAWEIVQGAAENDEPLRGGAFCAAFVCLIRGDRPYGRRAIEETLALLPEVEDARTFRMPMHWAACVYDWCYDLLTEGEKEAFIGEFNQI